MLFNQLQDITDEVLGKTAAPEDKIERENRYRLFVKQWKYEDIRMSPLDALRQYEHVAGAQEVRAFLYDGEKKFFFVGQVDHNEKTLAYDIETGKMLVADINDMSNICKERAEGKKPLADEDEEFIVAHDTPITEAFAKFLKELRGVSAAQPVTMVVEAGRELHVFGNYQSQYNKAFGSIDKMGNKGAKYGMIAALIIAYANGTGKIPKELTSILAAYLIMTPILMLHSTETNEFDNTTDIEAQLEVTTNRVMKTLLDKGALTTTIEDALKVCDSIKQNNADLQVMSNNLIAVVNASNNESPMTISKYKKYAEPLVATAFADKTQVQSASSHPTTLEQTVRETIAYISRVFTGIMNSAYVAHVARSATSGNDFNVARWVAMNNIGMNKLDAGDIITGSDDEDADKKKEKLRNVVVANNNSFPICAATVLKQSGNFNDIKTLGAYISSLSSNKNITRAESNMVFGLPIFGTRLGKVINDAKALNKKANPQEAEKAEIDSRFNDILTTSSDVVAFINDAELGAYQGEFVKNSMAFQQIAYGRIPAGLLKKDYTETYDSIVITVGGLLAYQAAAERLRQSNMLAQLNDAIAECNKYRFFYDAKTIQNLEKLKQIVDVAIHDSRHIGAGVNAIVEYAGVKVNADGTPKKNDAFKQDEWGFYSALFDPHFRDYISLSFMRKFEETNLVGTNVENIRKGIKNAIVGEPPVMEEPTEDNLNDEERSKFDLELGDVSKLSAAEADKKKNRILDKIAKDRSATAYDVSGLNRYIKNANDSLEKGIHLARSKHHPNKKIMRVVVSDDILARATVVGVDAVLFKTKTNATRDFGDIVDDDNVSSADMPVGQGKTYLEQNRFLSDAAEEITEYYKSLPKPLNNGNMYELGKHVQAIFTKCRDEMLAAGVDTGKIEDILTSVRDVIKNLSGKSATTRADNLPSNRYSPKFEKYIMDLVTSIRQSEAGMQQVKPDEATLLQQKADFKKSIQASVPPATSGGGTIERLRKDSEEDESF